MKILRAVATVALLLLVSASQSAGQVIAGPDGPVEFIGLQNWDAQELFDTIQELEPDRPFHACARVLKRELGFADAAAMLFLTNRSKNRYTVVVGVEDSTGVQYRPVGSEAVALPEAWQELQAVVDKDMHTLTVAARTLPLRTASPKKARRRGKRMGADPETLGQVWNLIDNADGSEDFRLAHDVLARDESGTSRTIATLLLGNSIDDETSWHGVVGSLIDPDARVNTIARSILEGVLEQDWDPVEWSRSRASLLALFGGTNPFAFDVILKILVATSVDPEFGQQVAREKPHLLLAHAGAEREHTREPAIAFLKAVSGEDYGTDLKAWTAWINR